MFLILKSKWHLHYTARMSIVCKLSVTRQCMCWFFHFLTIFKLIRCLKISLCTNTCSSNEIFNLLHLAVPVPSNAKAHVGNLWLQMKQESTNVFDYVWYLYAEVNSVSRVESNSCSSAGVAALQRRGRLRCCGGRE